MRILLVGEFSRLHNSLKEGLLALGHEVLLVSDGDEFKNYPTDFFVGNRWCNTQLGKFMQRIAGRLFRLDLNKLERGLRFRMMLPKLKGFDVVQLINEAAIKTFPGWELKLIRRLSRQNRSLFLLSSGADFMTMSFMMKRRLPFSILDPYFADPEGMKALYAYAFDFLKPEHKRLHDFLYQEIRGVIATDLDYVPPLEGHPKFLGMIPNPVNTEKVTFQPMAIGEKVVIFLGINRLSYHSKGIGYFEKALEYISAKFPEQVEIIIAENLPYLQYLEAYSRAHILLDQAYAQDQGYNALEAMARGKVVFTGGGKLFMDHFGLQEKVVMEATPDAEMIAQGLSELIENPQQIERIGERARLFIETEHNFKKIASRYLSVWETQGIAG